MTRLESWLQKHELSSIEQLLKAHDITLDVLPELTEQDLRELGLSLGLRRKLERAIRRNPPASSSIDVLAEQHAHHAFAPDRRQLTVMFVDLVGSTELSRKLDPEDLRQVIREYQNTVAAEVARHQGHIAQLLGDGVLCYFGWPVALEFAAEQAARASLDVVKAISKLSVVTERRLTVRIGIATGVVVVGELLSDGQPKEPMVSGETPNLAARLQQLTAPGTILIAPETQRILGNAFILERIILGPVKGFEPEMEAFRLIGEVAVGSRFQKRHGGELPPIVGRNRELDLLLERWSQAKSGEGQGVYLVGEAGIGKSRIVRALIDALQGETHQRIEAQCSSYYLDRPFWPIVEHFRNAFGIRSSQSMIEQARRLEQSLCGLGVKLEEAVPLNADLLDIACPPTYSALDLLTPQEKRSRTLNALASQLLALARRAPTLFVLEDAHWVDPSTLELLDMVLQSTINSAVLIVVTSRPDNQLSLAQHPHLTRLSLNRLGRQFVEAIVRRIAGDASASHEFVGEIVARTDGMPLFVEELTKALVETNRSQLVHPGSQTNLIPSTLYDSLVTRLDRIPEVKELAQTAACIGRDFELGLLATVTGVKHETLVSYLDRLVAAELVFRRGIPPHATYSFTHALVRDAAYETQLRSRRQENHSAILRAIEGSGANIQPEIAAHHAVLSGQTQKAISFFVQAGQQAIGRFANREALKNFTNALRQLENIPAGTKREKQELDLRLKLGLPLIAIRGYASEEVETHYRSTVELAQRLSDSEAEFTSTRSLWNCLYDQANLESSVGLSHRLVELANSSGSNEKQALALRALGSTLMSRGEFAAADSAFDNCLVAGADVPPKAWLKSHGEAPLVVARQYKGFVASVRGRLDEALQHVLTAVKWADKLGHPITSAFARAIHAHVLLMRRDYAECLAVAHDTNEFSTAHGFVFWSAHTEILEGVATANLVRGEGGLKLAERGLKNWVANGAQLHVPTWSAVIAEVAILLGWYERASELLTHALRVSDRTGDMFARAELYRLHGRLLLLIGNTNEGQAALERAITLARSQGAVLFELRAASDLVELLIDKPEGEVRRRILSSLVKDYRGHRAGFDYQVALNLLNSAHEGGPYFSPSSSPSRIA
ncbi:MAG TPA: AAA family ATPase [Xanthobacteraceae bacterium]